jgi:hypothetical protein
MKLSKRYQVTIDQSVWRSKCVQNYTYMYAIVKDFNVTEPYRVDYMRVKSGCTCKVEESTTDKIVVQHLRHDKVLIISLLLKVLRVEQISASQSGSMGKDVYVSLMNRKLVFLYRIHAESASNIHLRVFHRKS